MHIGYLVSGAVSSDGPLLVVNAPLGAEVAKHDQGVSPIDVGVLTAFCVDEFKIAFSFPCAE